MKAEKFKYNFNYSSYGFEKKFSHFHTEIKKREEKSYSGRHFNDNSEERSLGAADAFLIDLFFNRLISFT